MIRLVVFLCLIWTIMPPGLIAGSSGFQSLLKEPYGSIHQSILNFRFDEASVQLRATPPSHIRAWLAVQLAGWTYLLTEQDRLYPGFESAASDALDMLENRPESAERYYLEGDIHIWKAIVSVRREEIVTGAWNGRKAMLSYQAAARLEPDNPDVKKGTGAFKYVAGSIPSGMSWLASIFGLSGSIASGTRELEQAARFGSVSAAEARLFVAAIELFPNRSPDRAIDHLDTLLLRYPENGLLQLTKAVALQRDKQVAASVSLMEKQLPTFNTRMPAFADLIRFRIAEGYFFMNDHQKAIPKLAEFLQRYQGKSLKRLANFRLGLSYELTNQPAAAAACFRKVDASANNDFDLYMDAQCERWLNSAMTDAEKLLWTGRNYFDSGQNDAAFENLLAADRLAGTDLRIKAEVAYRIGRYHEHLGNPKQAITWYQQAARLCPASDNWIKANAWFQLGKIAIADGQTSPGLEWFQKADELDDHLFSRSLNREIDTERKRLAGK